MAGMNGDPMGGAGVPLLQKRPQRVAWENNEQSHRGIAAQIIEQVRNNGGGMPVGDPGSYLVLMLVLDRLDKLERKLDHITKVVERGSADAAEAQR